MKFPKTHRVKSRKHLEFVVSFRCILRGTGGCYGSIQAHHLLRPFFSTRGVGMRAGDNDAIPLCFGHHQRLHRYGNEDKYWVSHGLSEDFGRNTAKTLWEMANE